MRSGALVTSFAVLAAASLGTSRAPAPAAGGWTTGSSGLLGDVVYGPGAHVIDLSLVDEDPSDGLFYDPVGWRVVFDFQTLTVQAGATITFVNHPTRAPVVFRATGDVGIDGAIVLDGESGSAAGEPPRYAEPGPGGFRGGRGRLPGTPGNSAGFGPGGGFRPVGAGTQHGGNGSHRTAGVPWPSYGQPGATYGSPAAVPLVGGSGASAGHVAISYEDTGGGAGGGAILVGSDTGIELSGTISAVGGYFGPNQSGNNGAGTYGSGGSIRLVAPTIQQTAGLLDVRGGGALGGYFGGHGGIRVEVDGPQGYDLIPGGQAPDPSIATQLGDFLPLVPTVTLLSVWDPDANGGLGDWVPLNQDPEAEIVPPQSADLQLAASGPTTFRVEGRDVPLGAPLHVRVTHSRGQAEVDSTHTMGEVAGSTLPQSWTDVTLDLSGGVSAIQVRAELP